jgi:hypothetical protein
MPYIAPMWRVIPALLVVGFLVYYDTSRTLSPPTRLALYTLCLLLVVLCVLSLLRYA